LARLFGSPDTPDHRALHDARATVHVLHGLLERVGSLGVHSLEELCTYSSRVSPAQRRKRYLAEGLPSAPGVYLFRDARDEVLYVGTSVDIRSRVRTYFTASEHRTRMAEMVALATSVVPVVCATTLEAQVRELRLIAEHAPRYNRRFLESRLAYRIQELEYGGLKPATIARLEALGEQLDGGKAVVRRRRADDRPISGTRLIREFRGVEHSVTVLAEGFEYQGRPYKSLSAIARAIAGTRWNGWVFFGVRRSGAAR